MTAEVRLTNPEEERFCRLTIWWNTTSEGWTLINLISYFYFLENQIYQSNE